MLQVIIILTAVHKHLFEGIMEAYDTESNYLRTIYGYDISVVAYSELARVLKFTIDHIIQRKHTYSLCEDDS